MRNLRRSPAALVRGNAFTAMGAVLGLGGLTLSLALPGEAAAQTVGDVKLRAPNVLLLVDTSGSMNWPQSGPGSTNCNSAKTRWVILLETLTGTVNGLECNTGSTPWNPCRGDDHCRNGYRILSNGCSPTANDDGTIQGAFSDPYAWPYRNGGGKNKQAIGFEKLGGGWCWYNQGGGSDWSQQNDGILDIFGDKIRFGLMTFDALEEARNWSLLGGPYTPSDTPWGTANANARRQQDGGTDSTGSMQNSYWWESSSNNWLDDFPTSYGGTAFFPNSHGNDFGVLPYGTCTPVDSPPNVGFRCAQTAFDLGAKNSRARPWRGRLLGFGDPEASVPDTVAHNEMVQLAVVGHSRYFGGGTPLSAMMRDAYEFILKDTGTRGVQLPQLASDPVNKQLLGPLADPYIWGAAAGCRSQHVLIVTDGEPSGDNDDVTMATHARNLYADSDALASGDPVNTYVIGVGMDSATWTGSPATIPCQDLNATHLGAGQICERGSNPLQWKYADECATNGMGPDCRGGTADDIISDSARSSIRACCNILETAIAGRAIGEPTAKPYFPQTQAELKTFMSDLISQIAGGTLSRTVPVFAATSAGAQTVATNADSFEIRSSLLAPPGNGLWEGKLERVRWKCTGGTQAYTPGSSFGDDFAHNLKQGAPAARRFLTVSVDDHHPNPGGSIRPRETAPSAPDPNEDDCLYACGTSDVGDVHRLGGGAGDDEDVLQSLPSLKNAIDGTSGIEARDMLDLQGSDQAGCNAVTGANGGSWRDRCAERILQWYGGDPNPDGITPAREEALGGIYKSSPVIVEPPKPIQEDELFSNERSVSDVDTDSYVKKYGLRPTMLYAQSVDGQLHAFVLNANTDSGPFGAPGNVPAVTSAANNELWTFIPPAVMPLLWKNFDAHARLSDGPITVADVSFSQSPSDPDKFLPWRDIDDVKDAKGEYRTIMVVSGGPSVGGGFYYALDVTNPLEPRFLWQLSSAGEHEKERVALFGDSVPGAAITTLRLKEPNRPERMVPVAILSGGSVKTMPSGVVPRRMDPAASGPGHWESSTHNPRRRIRDWGDSVPARSVTVVELYSGRIIMRMGGQHCDGNGPGCAGPDRSDHPLDKDGNSILHENVLLPEDGEVGFFDSPMTSQPMPYPSGPGKVATRAYVGDADGTMWRLDLSDPDPKRWTAKIAFDAYNHSNSTLSTMKDARVQVGPGSVSKLGTVLPSRGININDANAFAIKGQPINNRPLISLDSTLQTTVSFATGDLEGFQLESPDAINVLVTFVDYYDSTSNEFKPYVNMRDPESTSSSDPFKGIEMAWLDGAGVTGQLNLFDGQLMFAYFVPRSTTTCTFGRGGWCAPKFLEHAAQDVPEAAMDLNGSPGTFELCSDFTGNEVVFGIQVNQKPSCQPAPDTFGDPWLAGSYKAITTSTTGAYEIVMHTGQGGTGEGGAQTKSTRKALKTPKSQTFVQSWVNAIE